MIIREERIGGQRLILGDCLAVSPALGRFGHVICDPPYEASLHKAKNGLNGRKHRNDGVAEQKGLDFAPIDAIRANVVSLAASICDGWFIAFCTVEGTAKWADAINPSRMKYKRACIWVKPDSTPQLNGQCPAQGAECFVTAWAGKGFSRWNGGGKRGVYTHLTNAPDREGTHPTEKPLRLMGDLLTDFTNHGDTVLDMFMGSGTTLISALRLGRQATGIEIDPAYFDLACKRVDEETRQPRMDLTPVPKPVQEPLL